MFYERITPGKPLPTNEQVLELVLDWDWARRQKKVQQPVTRKRPAEEDFWQQLKNGARQDWFLGTNQWSDASKFDVKPKLNDPFMGNEPEDPRWKTYIIDLSDDEDEDQPPTINEAWPESPCTCTGWGCECGQFKNF